MENTIRLYTSGREPDITAFDKLREFVHKRFNTNYNFEIIDVFRDPAAAKRDGIVVTPTVICELAEKTHKKVIGNIDDPEKTAALLGFPLDSDQGQYSGKNSKTVPVLQEQSDGTGGFTSEKHERNNVFPLGKER